MPNCTFELDPAEADGEAGTDRSEPWECPHEAHADADRCVFHLDPGERSDLGVGPEDVVDRLRSVIADGDRERKRLLGADLPAVHLEYERIGGSTRHPLDLRYADVDALAVDHAAVEQAVDLRGSTVGDLRLVEAVFEQQLYLDGATVTGAVEADECAFREEAFFTGVEFAADVSFGETEFDDDGGFDGVTFAGEADFGEAEFDDVAHFQETTFAADAVFEETAFGDDANFDDAVFEEEADFDEANFGEDASFKRVTFHGAANFRGVEVEGGGNVLEDNFDFEEVTFAADARFDEAVLTYADFHEVAFAADAVFEAAEFEADADFDDATFEEEADFDEARFGEDASFKRVTFHGAANFRGVEVEGGDNVLEDNADFEEATFEEPARFEEAVFPFVDFHEVTFAADAVFEGAEFDDDADFAGATFEGRASFDESRFHADGDFTGATFEGEADFRGVEFLGQARHLEDSARFEGAAFRSGARFDGALFTTVNFRAVTLGDTVDFRNASFENRLDVRARSADGTTYVDMTDADIESGSIAQPDGDWVRYDLTRARVGDVSLSAPEETRPLFDYFRILRTDFDGFEFSEHRTYLERNDWRLHEFDETGADYDPNLSPNSATVEATYLYAYNNAKAVGDSDAAMEFAIHQAQFRRKKNLEYALDGSLGTGYRVGRFADAVGNFLWHQTCGYGYRLGRILAVSGFVILTWAVLYAMPFTRLDNEASLSSVGALFSPEGVATVGEYLYYSLVTFTTVGYGDINPVNLPARFLAVTEGVLGVLLAALVVFVLGRRVAV